MYSVLPFSTDAGGNAVAENRAVEEWLGMITSDLIDNYRGKAVPEFGGRCFYDYLREEFGFHCKHRLLFHWGFNARPWSDALEEKISHYDWYSNPAEVERFKKAFITEQARRNRQANEWTERVFGLSSGGKEASWANALVSIVYDVHLLGDYVAEDNSDFDGVTPPSKVAGDIINSLRRLDAVQSRSLEREISLIVKSSPNEHETASLLIRKLQESRPQFILEAGGGALKRRLQAAVSIREEVHMRLRY